VNNSKGKSTIVYTWMNHAKKYGPPKYSVSAGRVSDHPYAGDNTFKITMWCRTCKCPCNTKKE
jgi:hypothetical protein